VIPPGLRATEYPALLSTLPHFNAQSFLKIASSGVLPNGKRLSDVYWYVLPKGRGVYYALEGYLFPDTYLFDTTDDESAVVQRMLDNLGEHLCPGPDAAHLDQYLHDPAQCKAHAAKVGPKDDNLFTAMEQRFFTTNDRLALYDTLVVASLVVRVTPQDASAPGVASVYYNRYLASRKNGYSPAGDYVPNLDSPASAQYARDSDHPPKDGNWWAPLLDDPATVDGGSAYNSASPDNPGLIPGPIAAPTWADISATATADQPTASPFYFVAADRCGTAHFARTLADFLYVSQSAAAGCYNR
jgi:cell division protein YceG involved in septum cleavage